jgi:nucleotide-binding universal stress UspA family protein
MNAPRAHPILLCYDGSVGSRRAIAAAAELFPGRAALVLHVWRPLAGIAAAYAIVPAAAYDPAEQRRLALQLAEEGAGAAEAAGLKPVAQIVEAEMDAVWHAILATADRDDAATIVLGARGLSPLRAAALGSVSHAVAQHAHRPVLIVPPAVPPAPQAKASLAGTHSETLAAS